MAPNEAVCFGLTILQTASEGLKLSLRKQALHTDEEDSRGGDALCANGQ